VPRFSAFLHRLRVPVDFKFPEGRGDSPRPKQVSPTVATVTGEATKGHASEGEAGTAEGERAWYPLPRLKSGVSTCSVT